MANPCGSSRPAMTYSRSRWKPVKSYIVPLVYRNLRIGKRMVAARGPAASGGDVSRRRDAEITGGYRSVPVKHSILTDSTHASPTVDPSALLARGTPTSRTSSPTDTSLVRSCSSRTDTVSDPSGSRRDTSWASTYSLAAGANERYPTDRHRGHFACALNSRSGWAACRLTVSHFAHRNPARTTFGRSDPTSATTPRIVRRRLRWS